MAQQNGDDKEFFVPFRDSKHIEFVRNCNIDPCLLGKNGISSGINCLEKI